jgi:hypothetical protein
MKKKIFIILGIVIIIFAALSLKYVFRKSNKGGITGNADLILPADSLVAYFNSYADSVSTARFVDKVIQVKGPVAEINNDSTGFTILLRDSMATEGVNCILGTDQYEKAKNIKVGDGIEVKGICAGKLIDVSLNNCAIVQ